MNVSQNRAPLLLPDQKRVVIIATDCLLGDFILSIPTIAALADYFINGVDLIVAKQHVPIARLLPSVNKIIPYTHTGKIRKQLPQLLAYLKLLLTLPFKRYQAAIFTTPRITESSFAVASMARYRIAPEGCRRSFVYNHLIPVHRDDPHTARRISSILQCIGQPDLPPRTELSPPAETKKVLEHLLNQKGITPSDRLAVFHPGAGVPWKKWPTDRVAAIADHLAACGYKICLLGTPGEAAFLESIRQQMKQPDAAVPFMESLLLVLALFGRGELLFSNESGPTHLAATTDIPIVTIFGPTRPEIWKPNRKENLTLIRKMECSECPDPRYCNRDWTCVNDITVEEVLTAISPYMRNNAGNGHTPFQTAAADITPVL